jgi:hypothetical protein
MESDSDSSAEDSSSESESEDDMQTAYKYEKQYELSCAEIPQAHQIPLGYDETLVRLRLAGYTRNTASQGAGSVFNSYPATYPHVSDMYVQRSATL